MKVVTAIFSVFHLLPPAAVQFLPELVERVINLEASLRRSRSSPFREPLIKYLNHYPNDSWQFFSAAMKDEKKGRFFAQVLADPESSALRETVVKEADAFVNTFTSGEGQEKSQAMINAIHAADGIAAFAPHGKTFVESEKVRSSLLDAARQLQALREQNALASNLRLASVQSGEQIMRIATVYLEHHPEDLDFLFTLTDSSTCLLYTSDAADE